MSQLGKKIDYLRISVTDRCNLKCIYCMPGKGILHMSQDELLTFEEIVKIVKILVSLGIRKVRLTGGEALLRRDVIKLIKSLVEIAGIEGVFLTTNGTLLSHYAEELKKAGVKRINISLDTLKADRFKRITQGGSICRVIEGIEKAKDVGFCPLKLNMVVMKGINDDEIIDFMVFSFSKGIIPRFIEFMKVTPLWREDYFMPIEEVMTICKRNFSLERLGALGDGPAIYYNAKGRGILGFIKTDEDNCENCARLRLTSSGELKSCLYETKGFLLREFLRDGFSEREIKSVVARRLWMKQYIDCRTYESPVSYMCSIGG